jgi:hypothetical protein
VLVAGERAALESISGAEVLVLGEAGGERLELDAAESGCDLLVEDADRVWRSLEEALEAGSP